MLYVLTNLCIILTTKEIYKEQELEYVDDVNKGKLNGVHW